MSAESLLVERAAESVALIAVKDAGVLTSSDPMDMVGPSIRDLQHTAVVQVALVLLRRFHSTAAGLLPQLQLLAAASESLAIPVLERLERCIASRPAFQSALSLTPLVHRAVVLGAQCCCLSVRDVHDAASACVPLAHSLTMLAEVLSAAVLDRVEHLRPVDSSRICQAHQSFSADQVKLSRVLSETLPREGEQAPPGPDGGAGRSAAQRALAPPPAVPTHEWRNEELRQFWLGACKPRHGGAAPVDVLALLLLRVSGVDAALGHREALMRRLSGLALRDPGRVSEGELDSCSAEVRRCGGLRAWVKAALLTGGLAPAAPAPSTGAKPFASTWSPAATPRGLASVSASTWPLSARTTGPSAAAAPERRRLFALSASAGRRPPSGGSNPLLDSVGRNLLKTTQHLILGEKVAVDARSGTFHETALHAAAVQDHRHAPLATLLLDHGADVNAEDRHLATPLHVAASTGNRELARKLVHRGADVCKPDRWSATPLHKAAASGQMHLVDLLLENGAAADASDDWGTTPLHRAVAHGQLAVAERLLASGMADANAEDRCGERPLHLAAKRGDYALVKLLLQHGGVATARSRMAGSTPEDCARARGHTDVLTLLAHRAEWAAPRSQAVVAAG